MLLYYTRILKNILMMKNISQVISEQKIQQPSGPVLTKLYTLAMILDVYSDSTPIVIGCCAVFVVSGNAPIIYRGIKELRHEIRIIKDGHSLITEPEIITDMKYMD